MGRSLAQHGFTDVVYIGDSGGNQRGMQNVAGKLDAEWTDVRAHYIREFYNIRGLENLLETEFGITEESEGYHDFYWITALMMVDFPEVVRYDERVMAGKASINGVSIEPKRETQEIGRRLMQWRVDETVAAIHAATGNDGTND